MNSLVRAFVRSFVSLIKTRMPIAETSTVTHTKDGLEGSFATSAMLYRSLSVASAISQSGCIQRGESATTAVCFNPRQQFDPPITLVTIIFAGFQSQREAFSRRKVGWSIVFMSETATLDLMSHLRLVLIRGLVVLAADYPE